MFRGLECRMSSKQPHTESQRRNPNVVQSKQLTPHSSEWLPYNTSDHATPTAKTTVAPRVGKTNDI